ncbi:Stk1 family PASTA domain-containing Ser/Thr kinase [Georgenia muralis]
MDTATLDPMIGRLVDDRYEVGARIARGGMATVYRAVDRRLERTVALKVMHPHLAESPDFVARFRREARAAARLTHPGVVAVHDQGTTGEASYLVMELVEGPNLRTVLRRRGALPLGEALTVVDHVLDALASAHRAGLVHRDIKPENVLLTQDGRPKVADFGLARAVSEATAATTGTVLGTVAYLAPEIVTEGRADQRADVYAVGVLLYELLTGRPPFTGDAPIRIAYQHVTGRVPAPSAQLSWLPAEVDELVGALTARELDERPVDAAAALALARRCVHDLDPADLVRRADVPPAAQPGSEEAPDARGTAAVDLPRRYGTVALPIGALAAREEGPARRARAWPRVVALLLAIALVAGAGALWWFRVGPGATVPVPQAQGQAEDVAVDALRDAGLVPVVTRTHHDDVAAGAVIDTDPDGGSEVRPDSEVAVRVSLGILTVPVPDVTGQDRDAAEDTLAVAGLAVSEVREEFDDTVPAGAVISSSPAAAEVVEHTTGVVLVVSAGREPVELPDVTGASAADAEAALTAAGLALGGTTEEYSDTVGAGLVLAQSPAPGEGTLYRGDTVDLVLSRGPELLAVPEVVGTQVRAARQTLVDAGFQVEVEEVLGAFFGTVRAQDPEAGSMLPRGSVITLTVV